MNNQDKYFKGQQKNEEFICFFRHHWITLVREFVYFIIFISIASLTVINLDTIKNILSTNAGLEAFFIIGFILGTVFIHRFFLKIFNYFVDVGIITNTRIVDHKKSLFFIDTMEAIDMANIQDLERKGEGLLPNILGYGDLIIYLSASASVKIFHGVPNAEFHFRCISRQKELRQGSMRAASGIKISTENVDVINQQNQILLEELKDMKTTETLELTNK
ncbi:MAG: PH domain-containing protein [Candidatus Gracilibacteria bacterium]